MRIRDAREGDLPGLIELFRETVRTVGTEHYTLRELAAWAPDDLSPEDWAPRLARNEALVAEDGGVLLGFAELSPGSSLDMLYVHKDHQGRGVATALLAAAGIGLGGASPRRATTPSGRSPSPSAPRARPS